LLAQTRTPTENVALFAEMLSLANDGRYPAVALVPQQRREKTLRALISQVELLERDCPVLTIFEDAHWIDPTSLEALSRAVDRIATLRVLMIVTFRPEFEAPWIGRPYVSARTATAKDGADAPVNSNSEVEAMMAGLAREERGGVLV